MTNKIWLEQLYTARCYNRRLLGTKVCVSTICMNEQCKSSNRAAHKPQQVHSMHAIQDLALFENLQGQPNLKNGTDTRLQLCVPSASIAKYTLPDVPMVLMAALHKLPA